jgi:hypothetical protein
MNGLEVRTRGNVVPTPEGARYGVEIEVCATTIRARTTLALVLRMMRRQERRNMSSVKAVLEPPAPLVGASRAAPMAEVSRG